jgi:hypothetical protein
MFGQTSTMWSHLHSACFAILTTDKYLDDCHKSLKFSGLSLSTLKTVRLPIPNKDYVESHLVMACAAGKMLHKTGLRMLQIECTGMKTSILGVCDRTRMKQYHLLRCHSGKFRIFLVLLIIAKKICWVGVSDCQELYCTHEEANTRMILHAIHADKTFG